MCSRVWPRLIEHLYFKYTLFSCFLFLCAVFFPSYAAIMDVLFLAYELKHALEFHEIRVRGIGVSELFEFRISYYLP